MSIEVQGKSDINNVKLPLTLLDLKQEQFSFFIYVELKLRLTTLYTVGQRRERTVTKVESAKRLIYNTKICFEHLSLCRADCDLRYYILYISICFVSLQLLNEEKQKKFMNHKPDMRDKFSFTGSGYKTKHFLECSM